MVLPALPCGNPARVHRGWARRVPRGRTDGGPGNTAAARERGVMFHWKREVLRGMREPGRRTPRAFALSALWWAVFAVWWLPWRVVRPCPSGFELYRWGYRKAELRLSGRVRTTLLWWNRHLGGLRISRMVVPRPSESRFPINGTWHRFDSARELSQPTYSGIVRLVDAEVWRPRAPEEVEWPAGSSG